MRAIAAIEIAALAFLFGCAYAGAVDVSAEPPSQSLTAEQMAGIDRETMREWALDVADKPMPPSAEPVEAPESAQEGHGDAERPEDGQAPQEAPEEPSVTPVDAETDYLEAYGTDWHGHTTDGLTKSGGVNYHDGRVETWYSSNVLYHRDTDQWTADEEGFYRDAEGRYVVAASDMPEGTVFEGSKGECVVLDSGCDYGVTDYYTAW